MHKIQQTGQVLFREVKVQQRISRHIFSVLNDHRDFNKNEENKKSQSVLLNFIFWYQERIRSGSGDFDKQGSKLNLLTDVLNLKYLY